MPLVEPVTNATFPDNRLFISVRRNLLVFARARIRLFFEDRRGQLPMVRTMVICNTASMPIAATESFIYDNHLGMVVGEG